LIFDNSVLYNTPDTVYHRTAARLKRQAAAMIEEAKKVEASLVFNQDRLGKTLEMRELEPIEGWEYSMDPWPGRAVREMSPLSSIGEEDASRLEKELLLERKQIELHSPPQTPSRRKAARPGGRGRGSNRT
jgi:hypothetical protein